jgi:Family of unknown function (DUF5819)
MPDHHPSGTAQLEAAPGVDPSGGHATPATRPEHDPDTVRAAPGEVPPPPPGRWSLPSRLLLRTAAVALACAIAWHLGTIFLYNAPANAISQRYQSEINGYVNPEFEQNWQLFAPNPISVNDDVEVRVQTLTADSNRPQSPWINLTAQDIAHIRDNPLPSHADQDLLYAAWDYYTSWHNWPNGRSTGRGGPLSEEYVKRIALQRLGRDWKGSPIAAIQVRDASTPIAGPKWTGAPQRPRTSYWTLKWWTVDDADYQGLSR